MKNEGLLVQSVIGHSGINVVVKDDHHMLAVSAMLVYNDGDVVGLWCSLLTMPDNAMSLASGMVQTTILLDDNIVTDSRKIVCDDKEYELFFDKSRNDDGAPAMSLYTGC